MTLRRFGLGFTALMVAVVLTALTWGTIRATAPQPTLVGSAAPDITLKGFDGRVSSLGQLRGEPVVLNFWASWCQSCDQEQAALNRAAATNSKRVHFVGADISDSEPAAKAYLADQRVNYLTGVADSHGAAAYHVKSPPETFLIDARGIIVARFTGPIDAANLSLYMTRIT